MKKQLLSVTALVAVGLIAALGASSDANAAKKKAKAKAPKVTVGGYTTAGWTYANNGDVGGANTGGLNAIWDSEIHFKVSGQMDNGVKLSAQVDVEGGIPNETDNIDDAWLKLSGDFGQLILGETDGASSKLAIGQMGDWATGVYSMAFERANIVPAPSGFSSAGPGFSLRGTLGDGDDPKTTYITPVMNGWQAGISFMKDVAKGANSIQAQTSTNASGENWLSLGLKYTGSFGKSKIGLGLGYGTVSRPDLADDKTMVMAGGNITNGPWKVALGMHAQDDPLTTTGASTDGQSWSAGIKYTAGAHKYSLTTFHGKIAADPTVTGDDESTSYMLAHNYAVSAGVTWMNALVVSDYDGEGTGATEDQSGMGVHSSVKFTF